MALSLEQLPFDQGVTSAAVTAAEDADDRSVWVLASKAFQDVGTRLAQRRDELEPGRLQELFAEGHADYKARDLKALDDVLLREAERGPVPLEIPEWRMPELEKRLKNLRKKAERWGFDSSDLGYKVVGKRMAPVRDAETGKLLRYLPVMQIQLLGHAPVVEDFKFVAKLEHIGAINLIHTPPADEDIDHTALETYRYEPSKCDHCRKARHRKDTFVLEAMADTDTPFGPVAKGEYRQVGRTCLADYLRDATAVDGALKITALLAQLWEAAQDSALDGDSEGVGGGAGRELFPLRDVLAAAAMAVRLNGWVSKADAEIKLVRATATDVSMLLDEGLAKLHKRLTEEDYERADRIEEWVKAIPLDSTDYLANLRAASLALPDEEGTYFVGEKQLGLVVSAVAAYRRAMERDVERKRAQEESHHVGEVGKRLDLGPLTVTTVREIEGLYGITTLVGFVAPDGNRFKWFASGVKDIEPGQVFEVKATIKKHDVYQGVEETQLSRAKLTEVGQQPNPTSQLTFDPYSVELTEI